jgi:hypothetical protein
MLTHRPELYIPSPNQKSPYLLGQLRAKVQPYRPRGANGEPKPVYGQLSETPTHTAYIDAADYYGLAAQHNIKANNFTLRHNSVNYRPLHPPLDAAGEGVLLEVNCIASL